MNLTPVDFKAVAAKGCFVYCYLRSKDGKHGKKFSPYYVGISTAATEHNRRWRPFASHPGHQIPSDVVFVRVLKDGLTKSEAESWEMRFIDRYQRVINGGMLHNKNDGGGSNAGFKHSPERRAQISEQMKGNQYTKGRKLDDWHVEICRQNGLKNAAGAKSLGVASGVVRAEIACEKYGVTKEEFALWSRNKKTVVARRYAKGLRGKELLENGREGSSVKSVEQKKAAAARKMGLDLQDYLSLTTKQLGRARYYWSKGLTGMELLQAVA